MLSVIDASEGGFGTGRFPEASFLLGGDAGPMVAIGPDSPALAGLGGEVQVRHHRWPRLALPKDQRLEGSSVHAFGRRPALWALAQGAGVEISLDLLEGPTVINANTRRWARRLSMFSSVTVRDEADAAGWRACGMPLARLRYAPVQAASLATRPAGDRAALRDALEIGDDEFLIWPVAAPWSGLDAQRLVFLLGLLRVHGTPAAALLPARAWRLAAGRRFGSHGGLGARVIVIDGAMSPWLPACDAAFLDSARPRDRLADFAPRGALRVLTAAAERAGVPVAVAAGSLLEADPSPAPSVAMELRPLIEIIESRVKGRPTEAVPA